MSQIFNPYLPTYEYVPDGEPHVFGDRLYVFGSHDRFGGEKFCMNDYVSWSAPVDDLKNWRFEGTIYKKIQDPSNPLGDKSMYAPDVAKGPDGRYYLYYGLADQFKVNIAVCDKPAGEYQYYGCVSYEDGTPWGEKKGDIMPFDPGILVDDDGRIHLYAGQGPMNKFHAFFSKKGARDSAYHVELDKDMKTIIKKPVKIIPSVLESAGTGFEEHEFFEANSIRKFNGRYYFIYSSIQSHELVYAMSDRPDGGYRYCGILHSNGDIGIDSDCKHYSYWTARPQKLVKAYVGNNHGSIARVKDHYYIFGHRHTNGTMFSRQGVAEEIFMKSDGTFDQAEMTSCGLNGGPLRGLGEYSAAIACNLQSKNGAVFSFVTTQTKKHPRFTQEGADREDNPSQYIKGLRDGALSGFKYFDFETDTPGMLSIKVRGMAKGQMLVYDSYEAKKPVAVIDLNLDSKDWCTRSGQISVKGKKIPLFFVFRGEGCLDFYSFELM